MRVFLDTKSDELRVELAQGAVAETMRVPADRKLSRPEIEVDVDEVGKVLEVRVGELSVTLEALGLIRPTRS